VVLRSLQTPPCDKVLTGAQAIIVDAAVCTKAAIALGGTELNELAGVGTGGGLSIGATPALFALLALGGTGAALSNSSSSASP
jgi:hypothetical protein